jgi:thiol-disulfide isomerase/thioredoxin
LFTVLPVAVVVVLVVVLVVVKINQDNKPSGDGKRTPATAAVVAGVTGVPAAIFDAVGAGSTSGLPTLVKNPPALTDSAGLPRVLYVGAEWCPFCAGERWSTAVALSRFGTFAGLQMTSSSSTDVHPSTATLSFYQSTFTGTQVAFTPYETATNDNKPLQTVAAADQKIDDTYNAPPYVTNKGAIPFLDVGGKYVFSGASYDVSVLSGLTQEQIAKDLSDQGSPVAKAIVGGANLLTAAICDVLPAPAPAVCSTAGVQAAASKLAALKPVG